MKKKISKKKLILILLGISAGVFLILSIVGYNYLSSKHFLKKFVFPEIEKTTELKIDVEKVDIKPFSKALFKGLSVNDTENIIQKSTQIITNTHSSKMRAYTRLSGKDPHYWGKQRNTDIITKKIKQYYSKDIYPYIEKYVNYWKYKENYIKL